jgi:hypothetical protein
MNHDELTNWKRLYRLADQVGAIAPWEYMSEYEVFCIREPEQNTLCFISILGELGEHRALSAYLGENEYCKLDNLKENPVGNPEMLLEISQLQLSFEGKKFLQDEDKAIIKELGLNYEAQDQVPVFRSFRDGYYPWLPEPVEVKMMIVIFEQSLEILNRIKKGSINTDQGENRFLVRYPETKDGKVSWKEEIQLIGFVEQVFHLIPDEKHIQKIKALPESSKLFDFDFSLLINPIKEKGDTRPYYSALALLADRKSEMVLGFELFSSKQDSNQRLEAASHVFLKMLSSQPLRPKGIDVSKASLYEIMAPVMERLGIRLRLVDDQPLIRNIRESFTKYKREQN